MREDTKTAERGSRSYQIKIQSQDLRHNKVFEVAHVYLLDTKGNLESLIGEVRNHFNPAHYSMQRVKFNWGHSILETPLTCQTLSESVDCLIESFESDGVYIPSLISFKRGNWDYQVYNHVDEDGPFFSTILMVKTSAGLKELGSYESWGYTYFYSVDSVFPKSILPLAELKLGSPKLTYQEGLDWIVNCWEKDIAAFESGITQSPFLEEAKKQYSERLKRLNAYSERTN